MTREPKRKGTFGDRPEVPVFKGAKGKSSDRKFGNRVYQFVRQGL